MNSLRICDDNERMDVDMKQEQLNNGLMTELQRLKFENRALRDKIRCLTKNMPVPMLQSRALNDLDIIILEEEQEQEEEGSAKTQVWGDSTGKTCSDVGKCSDDDWEELQRVIEYGTVRINLGDLETGKLLGQGSFGKTHHGWWRGAECVIKHVQVKEGTLGVFAREVQALACIRHPNVLALYGACVQPPESCLLVTEYLSGGSLNDAIHGKGQVRLGRKPLSVRLQILADVASGMTALEQHSPPIVHRDLKPSNVLLDGGLRAKVSDMGLARILDEDALVSLTPETGSYLYMAPEVVCHCAYATQADVWSWACLASEVLTLQRPYARRLLTPIQVAVNVAKGKIKPDIPPETPPKLAAIMQACFRSERTSRPTFSEISAVMNSVMAEQPLREKKARSQKWGQCF